MPMDEETLALSVQLSPKKRNGSPQKPEDLEDVVVFEGNKKKKNGRPLLSTEIDECITTGLKACADSAKNQMLWVHTLSSHHRAANVELRIGSSVVTCLLALPVRM